METRFQHIDEALSAIALREESITRILTSETGLELCNHAIGERCTKMYRLRVRLHVKRKHYLECENLIVDIM